MENEQKVSYETKLLNEKEIGRLLQLNSEMQINYTKLSSEISNQHEKQLAESKILLENATQKLKEHTDTNLRVVQDLEKDAQLKSEQIHILTEKNSNLKLQNDKLLQDLEDFPTNNELYSKCKDLELEVKTG